jgi:hypothetical protein
MSKETREIAEEIAKRITDNPCAHPSCCPHTAKAADAIEKALRDRDERAARTAESEVSAAAQQLAERGDEGRDILNYTDFIKGQKTAAQDILKAIRNGVADAKDR